MEPPETNVMSALSRMVMAEAMVEFVVWYTDTPEVNVRFVRFKSGGA